MSTPLFFKHYTVLGELGEGAYGTVYKIQNKNTGQICALKSMLTEVKTNINDNFYKEEWTMVKLK